MGSRKIRSGGGRRTAIRVDRVAFAERHPAVPRPHAATAPVLTTFDRFLVRRFLHTFGVLFVTFYGLYCVIDGFTNADAFTRDDASFAVAVGRMVAYYGWQSTLVFDLTGPVLLVCTVMVSLALMVKAGELAPMLACGVPTYRLALPLLVGTGAVTGLVVVNQELVLPRIADRLGGPRGGADTEHPAVQPVEDFSNGVTISAGRLNLATREVEEAEFTLPVPQVVTELEYLHAGRARFEPGRPARPATDDAPAAPGRPSGWVLTDVSPSYEELHLAEVSPDRAVVSTVVRTNPVSGADGGTSEIFVRTDIDFEQLHDRAGASQVCGTPALIRRIRNPAYSGNLRHGMTLDLHERFRQPLLNLLATLCAVPLVIRREARSLIVSLAACAGVMGGLLGLMQGGRLAGSIGLVGPDLAAWLPVIVTGALATALGGKVLT